MRGERPIIFSSPMVRALIEGRKTQTRRILKGTSEFKGPYNPEYLEAHRRSEGWKTICPYGRIGQRLWVRESVIMHRSIPQLIGYVADGCRRTEEWEKHRTAIHMPRSVCRLVLEITDIRVEPLQEISAEDARAEGALPMDGPGTINGKPGRVVVFDPILAYKFVWDSIHKAHNPWVSNPWVWVLSFRRLNG